MTNTLVERLAHAWGGLIGGYGRHATRNAKLQVDGVENIPAEACIWFSWHDTNLIALALHHRISSRPAQAFVPPGVVGAGMRGWLDAADFEWLGLPAEGTGNAHAALRAMRRGLAEKGDVVIAVDGPHGPSGIVKPGAFWLARLTGCAMLTVGFAARPSFRYPRWDRHLVPLPGARIAAVISKPMRVGRGQEIDALFLDSVAAEMRAVRQRAQAIL